MNLQSRRSPTYLVIADGIREQIESRGLAPGDRLPTERELVEEFGVARMTVRHALDVLQMEGLIERRRGRTGGTFVRSAPPVVELTRMEGVLPQLRQLGMAVSCEVHRATSVPAESIVAEALRIDPGAPVFRIVRVHSVEGTPMVIEKTHFPEERVPGLLEVDLSRPMYELLGVHWNLRPVHKAETIIPGVASAWEQEVLGITGNQPLLRICRNTATGDGVPLEHAVGVLRSDVARIRVVTGALVDG
ncbi:GntR family transcriptional regulator [Corynebacterium hylobatis]|uniref:GntR family transcriptional regulator n=1 Tax=Corynebacterium hylobatis TaxID=1859290 RepID=UPI001F494FDD|nr:GntR family transcriptional regulator [Corynebacterium hylobatis]